MTAHHLSDSDIVTEMRHLLIEQQTHLTMTARTPRARAVDNLITQIADPENRRAQWFTPLVVQLLDDLRYMDIHNLCHICGWSRASRAAWVSKEDRTQVCLCEESDK